MNIFTGVNTPKKKEVSPVIKPLIEKPPSAFFYQSGTDKVNQVQNYGIFYDMVFHTLINILNKPIKVLEVGVSYNGIGSGHAFSKMPYVEKFVGVDRVPLREPFEEKGIFIQGDAYHPSIFKKIAQHAPFHLIIDDGTHQDKHQQFFIKEYRRFLDDVSFLVCEDICDDEVEKWRHLLGKDIFLTRCPTREKLEEFKEHRDVYLSTILFKPNIPGNGNVRDHTEHNDGNSEKYYDFIVKTKEYLQKKKSLTSEEQAFIDAADIMCSGGPHDFELENNSRTLINVWYDKIREARKSLREISGNDGSYWAFKHVLFGIATDEDLAFVIDRIRENK